MQAWKNWRNEKPLEILDADLEESFSPSEVIRCIQIGLLCVQQNPDDRPTMERVVSYLSSVSVELPLPQEPALILLGTGKNPNMVPTGTILDQPNYNSYSAGSSSINDLTMSNYFPR